MPAAPVVAGKVSRCNYFFQEFTAIKKSRFIGGIFLLVEKVEKVEGVEEVEEVESLGKSQLSQLPQLFYSIRTDLT